MPQGSASAERLALHDQAARGSGAVSSNGIDASTSISGLSTACSRIASMRWQSETFLANQQAVSIHTHPLDKRRRPAPER
jgi:hypothetical protein